eukprot:scaffold3021_cov73-Phaeocystis_antarctica.AAC.5
MQADTLEEPSSATAASGHALMIEPAEHQKPTGHILQWSFPSSSWYLPVSQCVQSSLSGTGAYMPTPHGSTFAAPFAQRVPFGQISQSPALSNSGRIPTLPAGQSCVVRLPVGQNVPFSQAIGSMVPAPHAYPAGHTELHAGFDCRANESPTTPAAQAKGKSPMCSPGSKW